jgi:phosphomevalonate kinase
MRVYLICGKAGSGKNEVAEIIKDYLGDAVITGFSKYIKLFATELTTWDGNDNDKPRAYLQNMGDTLRSIDLNFMTKRVYEDLKVYEHEGINNVIVSDVRLINEVNYFKEKNDIETIAIRVNSDISKRRLNEEEKHHITETELDNYDSFDYVINNQFDDSLKNEVIKILEGE